MNRQCIDMDGEYYFFPIKNSDKLARLYQTLGSMDSGKKQTLFNNGKKPTDTLYSDRMWEWDMEKYDKIATKVFGKPAQIWSSYTTEQIEQLISEYLGEEIEVCFIEVNITYSGYSIYRADFKKKRRSSKKNNGPENHVN